MFQYYARLSVMFHLTWSDASSFIKCYGNIGELGLFNFRQNIESPAANVHDDEAGPIQTTQLKYLQTNACASYVLTLWMGT